LILNPSSAIKRFRPSAERAGNFFVFARWAWPLSGFTQAQVGKGQLLSSQARVGVTDEGIILKKSPLLIEPDSKKAGFSLL